MRALETIRRWVPPRDSPGAALFACRENRPASVAHPEIVFLAVLLLLFNTPGEWTSGPRQWGFQADAVRAGQWWRILTHPFAHVSLYHLVLDASAFLGLAAMLDAPRARTRLGITLLCALGALAGAAWAGPVELGYTGLSGAAHGLFVVVCGSLWFQGSPGAAWGLVVILGKCCLELLGGGVVLAAWHVGDVGVPVVAGHAGGVLAGLGILLPGLKTRWLKRRGKA